MAAALHVKPGLAIPVISFLPALTKAVLSWLPVLLQTLSQLHTVHLAHLDLNMGNVMLTQQSERAWDTVRLIDFGAASHSSPGTLPTCGPVLQCFCTALLPHCIALPGMA